MILQEEGPRSLAGETRTDKSNARLGIYPPSTTVGSSIFWSRNITSIRHAIERKAVGCAINGRFDIHAMPKAALLKTKSLQSIFFTACICRTKATPQSYLESVDLQFARMTAPIILDTVESWWGEDDLYLLRLIAAIEGIESDARKGGILL